MLSIKACFVKASVFHSVNSAPSANSGSNPPCGNNLYGRIYQIQVDNSSPAIYSLLAYHAQSVCS